ncbi:MAG: serine kinase [Ignavibacteria bacterium]|nr:serine kinase [Ignavibacteria bacterium]
MNIKELVEKLELKTLTDIYEPDREISGCYSGDLLSDVIANALKDNIWITMQTHLNIVAVAGLKELTGIIIVMNRLPDKDTIDKAKEERITILGSVLNSYQTGGKIFESGII